MNRSSEVTQSTTPIDIYDAALLVGLSSSKLRKLGENGPPYIEVCGCRRYFPGEVLEWLQTLPRRGGKGVAA